MSHLKKTLVIFDIDGTLLFSNKVDSQIFNLAFEENFGFPLPSLDWNHYPHVTDTSILRALFKTANVPHPSDEKIESFKDDYVARLEQGRVDNPQGFQEVPGAREIILQLIAHPQYEIGIATGGFRKPAFVKLNHVGIPTDSLFMGFADGNETREMIIHESLAQVPNLEQIQKTVYLGDAIWDVKTTRNLDMPFIGVRKDNDHEVLFKAGAHHVISHYPKFEDFEQLLIAAQIPKPLT